MLGAESFDEFYEKKLAELSQNLAHFSQLAELSQNFRNIS